MKLFFLFMILLKASAAAADQAPAFSINGLVKVDSLGWTPQMTKIAVITQDPKGHVEIRRSPGGELVLRLPKEAVRDLGPDHSQPLLHGDHVWQADFSALTMTGKYQVAVPALKALSYEFAVGDDVYDKAARMALKSFYYQRCGSSKIEPYSGPWEDAGPCHTTDVSLRPRCIMGRDHREKDYGELDLSGGWHDAGDFEKKIGHTKDCATDSYGYSAESLWYLTSAYEWNPEIFKDGVSNIPESGNGIPDVLDEARWELDWYLKMQRTDGHVLAKVFTSNLGAMRSPPSSDAAPRYYGPPSREAEAVFVASLARGARLFAKFKATSAYASRLKKAALLTWKKVVAPAGDSAARSWAAGELFRLDPDIGEVRHVLESSAHVTTFSFPLNHGFKAAMAYMASPSANEKVKDRIQSALGAQVDAIFEQDDAYRSGMPHSYYVWNSNWYKAETGVVLLWAVRLGATGGRSTSQTRAHAADFLHYFHGMNPLNMFYMTRADLAGGEHGVWQPVQVWFNDAHATERVFSGKPLHVVEPLWPYVEGVDSFGARDDLPSRLGPAPGFVPCGPTFWYLTLKGKSEPPLLPGGKAPPVLKAYRDFNFIDSTGARTQPWILNESGIYDTSSYLLLAAAFADGAGEIAD